PQESAPPARAAPRAPAPRGRISSVPSFFPLPACTVPRAGQLANGGQSPGRSISSTEVRLSTPNQRGRIYHAQVVDGGGRADGRDVGRDNGHPVVAPLRPPRRRREGAGGGRAAAPDQRPAGLRVAWVER